MFKFLGASSFWVVFAAISVLLFWICGKYPSFTESWYAQGLFPNLHGLQGFLLNWLPVGGPWLVAVFLLIWVWDVFRPWLDRSENLKSKSIISLRRLAVGACVWVVTFYWFWGFNYARLPINEKLGFQTEALSPTILREELELLQPALVNARALLGTQPLTTATDNKVMETQGQQLLNETLTQLGYPNLKTARLNRVTPKGGLLRLGATGVFLPWVGQANTDAVLHPAHLPKVAIHELAHAAGFADEAACDFLAALACAKSNDLLIRYSGLLGQWRLAASRYKLHEPTAYAALRSSLPAAIQSDLDEINAILLKYPSFFGAAPYDTYLKWQGVEEGVQRYDSAIALLRGFRKKGN